MSLAVLVPLILFGVALVPTLSWAFGWSALASLTPDLARQRFLLDHPEAEVHEVTVAADGLAALLWLGSETGIVFVVGDRFATRKLRGARIQCDSEGLVVRFREFGVQPLRITLAPPSRSVWQERLLAT